MIQAVLELTQRQRLVLQELILLTSVEYAIHLGAAGKTEFLHSDVAQELPGVMEEVQGVLRMVYPF